MKPTTTLLFAASLIIGSALSSCIAPIDAYGTTSTYRTYQPGYRLNSLPNGYRSEQISGSTYYYNDGHYYRPQSGGYVVVDAPRSSRYYSDYDSRRRSTSRSSSRSSTTYRDSRTGDVRIINTLPRGYREIDHRGTPYYQSGDQYYRRQSDGYMSVPRPY